MKKQIRILLLVMVLCVLFTSCQSVYEAPVVTTGAPEGFELDPNQEYYTTGYPYRSGSVYDGLLYEGCLFYIEECPTIGQVGEKIIGGVSYPTYGETTVYRVVKYNPVTGIVSSPCLDPSCNHSLESDCPMLFPQVINKGRIFSFRGIFGDWLVIWAKIEHKEYDATNVETLYNLKTGEVRRVHNEDLGTEVLTRWSGGSYYDGKYYRIKQILDYSNTGYKPGEGGSVENYTPETKCILCEYDFETDTTKELFEVPEDYNLSKVSNERFYFKNTNSRIFDMRSYSKDGSDKQRAESHNLGTSNLVGTYTIASKTNGYDIHDLKTDEQKEVIFDFTLTGNVRVTEKGILASHQTAYDEWKNFSAVEYRKQHPDATNKEVNAASNKVLSSGTAQIWQCGYLGEDLHMVYELKNAYIETIAAQGDYVFAYLTRYDSETGEKLNNASDVRCVINIKTGEITEIPYLDIVVPDEYLN